MANPRPPAKTMMPDRLRATSSPLLPCGRLALRAAPVKSLGADGAIGKDWVLSSLGNLCSWRAGVLGTSRLCGDEGEKARWPGMRPTAGCFQVSVWGQEFGHCCVSSPLKD